MSFRITALTGEKTTTIRVEGRLTAEALPDLQREFQLASAPVLVDLSGLIAADAESVRELRALAAKGAKLRGASAFIRQLLDAPSS